MADFRRQIRDLQTNHSKAELVDVLAERTGERATSVNPLTETMFARLGLADQRLEYARKSEGYSQDMSRVATNATALKMLLHEQVVRPLYEPVERIVKQDLAECIAAVDAFEEGHERGPGIHFPTTLPLELDEFVDTVPDRTETPESPFSTVAELGPHQEIQIDEIQNRLDTDGAYFIYVLDCTPATGTDEPLKVQERRKAVQTKIESGRRYSELQPKEQATHALNQNKRVYYVGSTDNVPKRVTEHAVGTDKSGVNFTNTLSPRSLVEARGCSSRHEAGSVEGALAREINAKDSLFAYSDEM